MIWWALGAAAVFLFLLGALARRRCRSRCSDAFGRGIIVGRTVARLDNDQFALLIDGTGVAPQDADDAA